MEQSELQKRIAANDAILRRAASGECKVYVRVYDNGVVTQLGPRPTLFDASPVTGQDGVTYKEVDPKDPFHMMDLNDEDVWVWTTMWNWTPVNTLSPEDYNVPATVPDEVMHVLPEDQAVATFATVSDVVKVNEAVTGYQQKLLEEFVDRTSDHGTATGIIESEPNIQKADDLDHFITNEIARDPEFSREFLEMKPHGSHIIVRHSELVDAASCLKSYNLKWMQNLRPRRTDPKLVVGTMVHAFMDAYEPALTNIGPKGMVISHAEMLGFAAVDNKLTEFVKTLAENDAEGKALAAEAWSFATQLCQGYAKWRAHGDGSDLSPIQQSEATFNFMIGEIDGVEVILSGTMDGVGVTRVTDGEPELWLREYKTCASIKDKLKQYRLDKQTRRYVGAARMHGVHFAGVELVLVAKSLPYEDIDFLLKNGTISRDMSKWAKANYEQALRVSNIGKFVLPDSKNGLTEQGFHDILKTLKGQPNPFFHVERLRFNDHELDRIIGETVVEAHRVHVTRETASRLGDLTWTRNQGIMGMNCKGCSVRDLCEMELKGVSTDLLIQEHFITDASIHAGKELDDTDD